MSIWSIGYSLDMIVIILIIINMRNQKNSPFEILHMKNQN